MRLRRLYALIMAFELTVAQMSGGVGATAYAAGGRQSVTAEEAEEADEAGITEISGGRREIGTAEEAGVRGEAEEETGESERAGESEETGESEGPEDAGDREDIQAEAEADESDASGNEKAGRSEEDGETGNEDGGFEILRPDIRENPDWTEYLKKGQGEMEEGCGHIPLPVELGGKSVLKDPDYAGALESVRGKQGASYTDSKYAPDAADLPELRNQNPNGTCWAYGAMAAAEMDILSKGYKTADKIDLSEMQTVYFTHRSNQKGSDPLGLTEGDTSNMNLNEGGNSILAAQAMANWTGLIPQDELDAAESIELSYVDSGYQSLDYDHEYQYTHDTYHLQGIYVIPSEDRDLVKQHILEHGAVQINYKEGSGTSVLNEDSTYNESANAYYNSVSDTANHAVSVVGWDDDFSASNFSVTPEGDGAWLIRNSWTYPEQLGTPYTHSGYFWMSYYDKTIESTMFSVDMEEADNYDNNYQYDGGIYFGYSGYGYNNDTNTYANVFSAAANGSEGEILRAVSFELAGDVNVDYTIEIYTALTDSSVPTSGQKKSTVTGQTDCEGYYTVKLPGDGVELAAGDKFAVVVTLSKTGGNARMCMDCSLVSSGWDIQTKSDTGVSFLQSPATQDWMDMASGAYNCNYRIKAFTDNTGSGADEEVSSITLDRDALELAAGESGTLTATVDPESFSSSLRWRSSDSSVAAVDGGTVTAVAAGSATITAYIGNVEAECSVTVTGGGAQAEYIYLDKYSMELTAGSTDTLTATVYPEGVTETPEWKSSDESVATVDEGTVTAVAAGSAAITAYIGDVSASCYVTVTDSGGAEAEYIYLDRYSMELTAGSTDTLTATVYPEGVTETPEWKSSDEGVARVYGGTVTAVAAGTAAITAYIGDVSASCEVTVTGGGSGVIVTDIYLSSYYINMDAGTTYTLTADTYPEGVTETPEWKSSDESVATVYGGTVTAIAAGTAAITAYIGDVSASCEVTVTGGGSGDIEVESLSLDYTSLELAVGDSQTLTAEVLPENATDKSVTWESTDTEVASVAYGVVTALSEGTTAIIARSGEKFATCAVVVKNSVVEVDRITINETSMTLEVGGSAYLTATVEPDNATDKTVVWTSDNEETAVVSDGTVTALKEGSATIKASAGGKSAACVVVVKEPVVEVERITLNETSLSLEVGEGAYLTATVEPDNATDKTVAWASNDEKVVSVSDGSVTALSAGSATVTASCGGKLAVCVVVVKEPVVEVEGITLDKTSLSLEVGGSAVLTAEVLPENATDKTVTWESNDEKVATVSGGVVTAVSAGTAAITAAAGEKAAACVVVVKEPVVEVEGITLDKTSLSLEVGGSAVLTAEVLPENATDKTVTWTSDNEEVVTVSSGDVTALSAGSAVIRASAGGKTAVCAVIVTVPVVEAESITLNETSLNLKTGDSSVLTAEVRPENATDKTVTWSSDNEEVAVVSDGTVTAAEAGEAVITARCGSAEAYCHVTVEEKEIQVTGIELSEESLTLTASETYKLTATVIPEEAANKKVLWSTSDSKILTVYDGLLSAKAPGSAKVTAMTEDGGYLAVCEVTVKRARYSGGRTRIYGEDEYAAVSKGKMSVTGLLEGSGSTGKVKYVSSDKKTASVSKKGELTGKNPGTARIDKLVDSGTGWETVSFCEIRVIKPVMEKTHYVAVDDGGMNGFELLSGIDYLPTSWESSNPLVASVDEDGYITFHSSGKVKITAVYGEGKLSTKKKYKTKLVLY